jgi:hypothetical protein
MASAFQVQATGYWLFILNAIYPLSLSPGIIVIDGKLAVQAGVASAIPAPIPPAPSFPAIS